MHNISADCHTIGSKLKVHKMSIGKLFQHRDLQELKINPYMDFQ